MNADTTAQSCSVACIKMLNKHIWLHIKMAIKGVGISFAFPSLHCVLAGFPSIMFLVCPSFVFVSVWLSGVLLESTCTPTEQYRPECLTPTERGSGGSVILWLCCWGLFAAMVWVHLSPWSSDHQLVACPAWVPLVLRVRCMFPCLCTYPLQTASVNMEVCEFSAMMNVWLETSWCCVVVVEEGQMFPVRFVCQTLVDLMSSPSLTLIQRAEDLKKLHN